MHHLVTPEKVVIYDEKRWSLLKKLRNRAIMILELLLQVGIKGILYGSIARGDVREGSDVDVVVLRPTLPSLIE
ncbi:MAG TPA: DNA polymerase subunit beta, partial [Candidatus Korarchaeota archaeon]|nr:DNA polymerase subunit beta [Candidatus Korarchaeota archaeon]